MRILFATYSEKSHLFSMVPLAWAFRAAGHEVRIASNPELEGAITRTGLTAVPVGHDHDLWRVLQTVLGATRWAQVPPFDAADVPSEELTWERLRAGYEMIVPWWFQLINEAIGGELIEFCRSWEPDLVVWEPTTYVGAVAAEAVGVPHVRTTLGVDVHGRLREEFVRLRDDHGLGPKDDPLASWLARVADAAGVEYTERLTLGYATIDQLPSAFRLPSGITYVPMRYVPYNGPSAVDAWLREPPSRPRVGISLGLTASDRGARIPLPVREIVRELAGLDVEVVAAPVTDGTDMPVNVRCRDFVPLHALAPTCAVMVHHAGFGSTATSSLYRLPQLAIPSQLEAPSMARVLDALGVGLRIDQEAATPGRVRAEVERLLTDPTFGAAAARLGDEMSAMPTPTDVVPALLELARQGQRSAPAT
ncbi:activator-dependent family glycosyltransferase [Spiractinospora alimapuensis]|uniref:activator-dependent family glycosyltransferase n=1 Tax=Spiractinospora alimapuensis TaxID=2820884 RepID=UPI001F1BE47C|nr:activator-dependent family glycosyltransferase [Spiractinospora alimapuensis]QVQ51826.1 activator-dependent family glycosyltransferase [Spiractinospora alimapuensis]